jgi:DNA-binding NarL/FixJ family response regulator
MSTRVLLVDDHEMFLAGLDALLNRQQGMEVVGKVKDGMEAVKVARARKPDVVVMDISMAGMNGIEATREITHRLPGVKVLCLSMHSERRFVAAALDAGASGYLVKDNSFEELVGAIRTVKRNQIYLCPTVAGTVVEAYRAQRMEEESSVFSLLTRREREVLQLLAEGRSTKEIAARLGLSLKTVGTHRGHIMEKLSIHSVAGLTKYAIREGLTTAEE